MSNELNESGHAETYRDYTPKKKIRTDQVEHLFEEIRQYIQFHIKSGKVAGIVMCVLKEVLSKH